MIIAFSNSGKFVAAEGGGDDVLRANRDAVGDWEKFELSDGFGVPMFSVPSHRDNITLRTTNNPNGLRFVYAPWGGGDLNAGAITPINCAMQMRRTDGVSGPIAVNTPFFLRSPQRHREVRNFQLIETWGWVVPKGDGTLEVVHSENPPANAAFVYTDVGIIDIAGPFWGRQIQTPRLAAGISTPQHQFQERFDRLADMGYRIRWIQGYPGNFPSGQFADIWVRDQTDVSWVCHHQLTLSQLRARDEELRASGLGMICISAYPQGAQTSYAAIWWSGVDSHWDADLNADQYQARFNEMTGQGRRLIHVNGSAEGNAARYAGIWAASAPLATAHHGASGSAHQAMFDDGSHAGLQPDIVCGYRVGGQSLFASLWHNAANPAWAARHNISDDELQRESVQHGARDLYPVSLSGYGNGWSSQYAGVWQKPARQFVVTGRTVDETFSNPLDQSLEQFMRERNIPNASLAISIEGKLVHARGYSYVPAEERPVHPTHLFRIASISKPITAAGIFKLVQDGRLNLDASVWDLLSLPAPDDQPADRRVQDITVRHLLQHVGGWKNIDDNERSPGGVLETYDPMFMDGFISMRMLSPKPISKRHIMRFVALDRRLEWSPGTVYDYSNFGYMLLGRVIEQVSGSRYEDFMLDEVLGPMGVRRMVLGKTKLTDRHPKEVSYYTRAVSLCPDTRSSSNTPVMQAYGGFNLENMDSHGGWIASAIDLVKFANHFDARRPQSERNVITEASRKIMMTVPVGDDGQALPTKNFANDQSRTSYACGWGVQDNKPNHTGQLPGTRTFLKLGDSVTFADGTSSDRVTWSLLFNKVDPYDDPGYDPDSWREFAANRRLNSLDWSAGTAVINTLMGFGGMPLPRPAGTEDLFTAL